MFDRLVAKLGRFDSIVTAHGSGDYLKMQAAVARNIEVQRGLLREAAETARRANRVLDDLIALDVAVDDELFDITVVTFHKGTDE